MSAQPRRTQLRRERSTNPIGVVSVARPGPFGNPWRVVELPGGGWTIEGPATPFAFERRHPTRKAANAVAAETFARFLAERQGDQPWAHAIRYPSDDEIRKHEGQDAACFCGPDDPCHGDAWLRVAAGGEP